MSDVASECQTVVRNLMKTRTEELASADIREKVQELIEGTPR